MSSLAVNYIGVTLNCNGSLAYTIHELAGVTDLDKIVDLNFDLVVAVESHSLFSPLT